MLKLSGTAELKRLEKQMASAQKHFPKAEAAACNKAGRVVRTEAKKRVTVQTGLPAGPVGKRLHLKRADARKPKIYAKVTGFQQKFSASYRKGGTTLLARKTKAGARVGKKTFAGSWIGKSGRRGREFVGRRTGKKNYPIVYPSVNIGRPIERAVRSIAASKGARVLEHEMGRQVEKRLAKHFR